MKPQTRLLPPLLIAAAWLGMLLCPLYAIALGGASRAMADAPKLAHDGITGAPIRLDILPFDAGLQKERDLFLALVPTTAAQAQRYQFKVEREATKLPPAFHKATDTEAIREQNLADLRRRVRGFVSEVLSTEE